MDTSEPTVAAPPVAAPPAAEAPASQSRGNGTAATWSVNKAVTHFAVAPFNSNPQTPRAIEIVAKLRVTSPSLEAAVQSGASPRIFAEELRLAMEGASSASPPSDRPRSDRPARGRLFTIGRVTLASARRASAASSPAISPSPAPRRGDATRPLSSRGLPGSGGREISSSTPPVVQASLWGESTTTPPSPRAVGSSSRDGRCTLPPVHHPSHATGRAGMLEAVDVQPLWAAAGGSPVVQLASDGIPLPGVAAPPRAVAGCDMAGRAMGGSGGGSTSTLLTPARGPDDATPAPTTADVTVAGHTLGGSLGGSTSTLPIPARRPVDQEAPGLSAGLGRAGRRGVLCPHPRHLDGAPIMVSAMMRC
jgi:hypothetical protein